jgi:hypothetical protein
MSINHRDGSWLATVYVDHHVHAVRTSTTQAGCVEAMLAVFSRTNREPTDIGFPIEIRSALLKWARSVLVILK